MTAGELEGTDIWMLGGRVGSGMLGGGLVSGGNPVTINEGIEGLACIVCLSGFIGGVGGLAAAFEGTGFATELRLGEKLDLVGGVELLELEVIAGDGATGRVDILGRLD